MVTVQSIPILVNLSGVSLATIYTAHNTVHIADRSMSRMVSCSPHQRSYTYIRTYLGIIVHLYIRVVVYIVIFVRCSTLLHEQEKARCWGGCLVHFGLSLVLLVVLITKQGNLTSTHRPLMSDKHMLGACACTLDFNVNFDAKSLQHRSRRATQRRIKVSAGYESP